MDQGGGGIPLFEAAELLRTVVRYSGTAVSGANLRLEKKLNFSINPRKLSLDTTYFLFLISPYHQEVNFSNWFVVFFCCCFQDSGFFCFSFFFFFSFYFSCFSGGYSCLLLLFFLFLDFQIFWFVMFLYANIHHRNFLHFVCFLLLSNLVLSANRVDLGFFCFINFPILLPPPPTVAVRQRQNSDLHRFSAGSKIMILGR